MKQKNRWRMIALLIFSAALVLVPMLTGAFQKSAFQKEEMRSQLVFSHESGFYDAPFYLEITGPEDAQIFYTTDGSEPNASHTPYTEPILIGDATPGENLYASRTDVSTGFYTDYIREYTSSEPPGYEAPDYPVDKCTVIRAVVLTKDEELLESQTHSFFVGFQEKTGYRDIPVVSLVVDPYSLFDYEHGIYTLGKDWDDYVNAGFPYDAGMWVFWGANYLRRGREEERAMYVEFFDAAHTHLYHKKGGIRVRGAGSRARPAKSMNLYAREEYDGTTTFDAVLFPESSYRPKKVVLYSGGHDPSVFRDYLMHTLNAGGAVATQKCVPCILFLNGEYWGVYHIMEKFDKEYIEHYYGVNRDDVILIKENKLEEGTDEDLEAFREMVALIADADMKDPAMYEQVCGMIDIESYTEYYATMLCAARWGDWPDGNYALWRVRRTQAGPYGDGRWRWILYDIEGDALTMDVVNQDTIAWARQYDAMFDSMLDNQEFRKVLADKMLELMDTRYAPELVEPVLDAYEEKMSDAMEAHYKRYYGGNNQFPDAMEDVRLFLRNRRPYVEEMTHRLYDEAWEIAE